MIPWINTRTGSYMMDTCVCCHTSHTSHTPHFDGGPSIQLSPSRQARLLAVRAHDAFSGMPFWNGAATRRVVRSFQ
eukprot:2333287-Prymnesium_polylepis.1